METAENLMRERYINLGTFRKSGVRVDTPVWAAAVDGKLYVYTSASTGKVKRLRNSPRVELAGCDGRGRTHTDWVSASARIVDGDATIERAFSALRAKYGLLMRIFELFSRLRGVHQDRTVLEIEISS